MCIYCREIVKTMQEFRDKKTVVIIIKKKKGDEKMESLVDYEILVWEKNGKHFVSHNYPSVVSDLTKKGYNLIADLQECKFRIEKALDEPEEEPVEFDKATEGLPTRRR